MIGRPPDLGPKPSTGPINPSAAPGTATGLITVVTGEGGLSDLKHSRGHPWAERDQSHSIRGQKPMWFSMEGSGEVEEAGRNGDNYKVLHTSPGAEFDSDPQCRGQTGKCILGDTL